MNIGGIGVGFRIKGRSVSVTVNALSRDIIILTKKKKKKKILSTLIPSTNKKDTFNFCTGTRRQISRRFSFFTNIFHLPTALFDFIFLDFVSLQDEGREEKIN